jgi:hypothetical protein
LCSGFSIVINLAWILVEVSFIICDCYILALVDNYNCFQLHDGLHIPSLDVIKLAVFSFYWLTTFAWYLCVIAFAVPLKTLPCWCWELHLGQKRNGSFNRRLNLCALAFCSDLRLMC